MKRLVATKYDFWETAKNLTPHGSCVGTWNLGLDGGAT